MITSNGARVTDIKTGKVIYTAPISSIDALSLIDECTRQRFGVTAHIDDEYITLWADGGFNLARYLTACALYD